MTPLPPNTATPSFARRVTLAFGAFFRVLGDADFAARYARLHDETATAPSAPSPANASPAPSLKDPSPDSALQLLALLQRDARLIDFVNEDLASYADAQIGAAARLVHEGCAKVLREHFSIAAVRDEAEGSRVTLPPGFDASAVRLTGNVVGQPPFSGNLTHRGWRVTETRLPKLAERHDTRVLAPAEVEL